jgi:hypothetical protein
MSRAARTIVLMVALKSLLGAMASTAGAVTWTNTGDTAFTATSGSSSLSVTGVSVNCALAQMTGTTHTGALLATGNVITATTTYLGCRLSGFAVAMDCRSTFTASALSAGVTSGNIDHTCDLLVAGMSFCHVQGTTPGTYTNPAGSFGGLTLSASTTLVTANGAIGTCPLTAGETANLSAQPFGIATATGGPSAPHTGPVLARD